MSSRKSIAMNVNGVPAEVSVEARTSLADCLRDTLNLTGTKFGCGVGACGACTVHLDGQPVRACVVPLSACDGRRVTTIEGLRQDGRLHPVQQAWIDHQVPQCGFCQSGMIMAAAALLQRKPHATDADVAAAITNICRCGTYPRIKRAIRALAQPDPAEK